MGSGLMKNLTLYSYLLPADAVIKRQTFTLTNSIESDALQAILLASASEIV